MIIKYYKETIGVLILYNYRFFNFFLILLRLRFRITHIFIY